MVISGRVQNGVIVPEGNIFLPEGAIVCISYDAQSGATSASNQRVQLPLVPSANPGSVSLTGERIAEILDEEDASRH